MKYKLISTFEGKKYCTYDIEDERGNIFRYEIARFLDSQTDLWSIRNDNIFTLIFSINADLPFDKDNIEKTLERFEKLFLLK
jgi:hypothetical protein